MSHTGAVERTESVVPMRSKAGSVAVTTVEAVEALTESLEGKQAANAGQQEGVAALVEIAERLSEGVAVNDEQEDGVGGKVVKWQGMPEGKAKNALADRIVGLLRPTIRSVAARFTESARGSLQTSDLEQFAALEAFKFLPKYDHSRAGSTSFEQHVYRRALRACVHHVQMHAHDVHPSKQAQRYPELLKKGQCTNENGDVESARVFVKSRDAQGASGGYSPESFDGARELDNGGSAYSLSRPGAVDFGETPESLLDQAQLSDQIRDALLNLSPERQALVKEFYGIGASEETSLREMARRRGVPRSRLAWELDEALKEMRSELECP